MNKLMHNIIINNYLVKIADMGKNPSESQINPSEDNNVPEGSHSRDLLNTGIVGAAGFGSATAAAHVAEHFGIKNKYHLGALGGGLGLLADYAAVRANNAVNKHLDKKASQMNKYLEKVAKIEIDPKNKGLLHKKMGKKPGSPISTSALESEKSKAQRSGNTKLEREAQFAINARKWHHR